MRNTLWTLLIFCLLARLPPIRKSEKYVDILTDAEKARIEQLLIEKNGFFNGTWRMVNTVLLVPFRSWHEIFAGNKGLGYNPFGTLCGAASLIIVVLLIADWHFVWFYD